MVTNVLLLSGELSQEMLLISYHFPGGLMPSFCVAPCWTDVLPSADRKWQTFIHEPGAWDDVLIGGNLLSSAGGTRKLSSLLHPKLVLVLKRVTTLCLCQESSSLARISGPLWVYQRRWMRPLAELNVKHATSFCLIFVPLLLFIYKLDPMFLGFFLSPCTQKPLKKSCLIPWLRNSHWYRVCHTILWVPKSTVLSS